MRNKYLSIALGFALLAVAGVAYAHGFTLEAMLTGGTGTLLALTIPPTFPARNSGEQNVFYFRKRFTFADSSAMQAGLKIGRLPSRSFIHSIKLYKAVAFNSATSDNLTIGTTAAGNDILAATVLTGTGYVDATAAAGLGIVVGTAAEQDFFMKWVAVGAAATTGDVTVVITFLPDNDA